MISHGSLQGPHPPLILPLPLQVRTHNYATKILGYKPRWWKSVISFEFIESERRSSTPEQLLMEALPVVESLVECGLLASNRLVTYLPIRYKTIHDVNQLEVVCWRGTNPNP